MKTLLAVILVSAVHAMAANVYTFTVPDGVSVTSPAGTSTGWGYTIQNQSSTDWLVITNLHAGAFAYATPQLIFDFPDLAPGANISVPYNPVTPAGLYQILWDQNVPAGFVNSGNFTLDAQWWSGDPNKGGTLIGPAPSMTAPYSASLTAAAPEPSTLGFTLLAALGVTVMVAHRLVRGRHRPAVV